MWVDESTVAWGWTLPFCCAERQTSRPMSPPYQPIRYTLTSHAAAVETNKATVSPRWALGVAAAPRIWSPGPAGMRQSAVPGRAFSAAMGEPVPPGAGAVVAGVVAATGAASPGLSAAAVVAVDVVG